jgi:hypothetical protein
MRLCNEILISVRMETLQGDEALGGGAQQQGQDNG